MKTLYFVGLSFLISFSAIFAQVKVEKLSKIDGKVTEGTKTVKVESPTAVNSTNATTAVASYDFTQPGAAYTTGPDPMVEVETGVWAMIAGDANGDGAIDATDQNAEWRPNNGQPWDYSIGADMNLDGSIDATDLNAFWRPNNGKSTQVPN